jgi:hypothetical protein
MQHNLSQPTEIAGDRRVDLDWVRIGAFGLLILYHVGMFYVPWSWHIKSMHSARGRRGCLFRLSSA